jgi:phosphoribosyl 1,2-cyclic phosphodiesterase
MTFDDELVLKFWGVRGSTPTPQVENLGFGGNTPCVEVQSGSDMLILDGGSGLRMLGQSLVANSDGRAFDLHVFLTHFHWDHIQGLPFFAPAYDGRNFLTYYSGVTDGNLRDILEGHMAAPYFPVQFQELVACRSFEDVKDRPAKIGPVTVHSFPLNHPQRAAGFRIESPHGVIVYATDLEHGDPKLDSVLRDYSTGASVLIFDAQYTPEEYAMHRGWGHSTWLEATRVARDAGVGQLILFHHDPCHSDSVCERIVSDAAREFENTVGAMEGSVVRLGANHSQSEPSVKKLPDRPTMISALGFCKPPKEI